MANLFYGKVNTNNAYVELSEIIGTELTPEVTYSIQPLDVIAMYISAGEVPTEGGFIIQNNPIVKFELKEDETVYIRTFNNKHVTINVAM